MSERDDEAWRAIVENYGERPSLDDPGAHPSGDTLEDPDEAADDTADHTAAGSTDDTADDAGRPTETAPPPAPAEDRFVPPPPPPLPYVAPPRLAAGAGVFGAPLVLLICVIGGFSIPGWLGYLLVAAFVGGFAYLVMHMKKRPDDPWDDGARV